MPFQNIICRSDEKGRTEQHSRLASGTDPGKSVKPEEMAINQCVEMLATGILKDLAGSSHKCCLHDVLLPFLLTRIKDNIQLQKQLSLQ